MAEKKEEDFHTEAGERESWVHPRGLKYGRKGVEKYIVWIRGTEYIAKRPKKSREGHLDTVGAVVKCEPHLLQLMAIL